ncbi:MAG: cell division protein FtsA [Gammaproteobacteria bacterium]|nr:cell division protein FtsA [Gammaproteobacteria bacterium]
MTKAKNLNLFAAIDVGSSKIAVCIGHVRPDGHLEVVSFARRPSTGVHQGIVVDMDKTVREVEATLRNAEAHVSSPIEDAVANLNGNHLSCLNAMGSSVTHKGEVAEKHVKQALYTAQAVNLSAGNVMLHVLPQQYIVDNQVGIVQPLGQAGKRLDANVHMIMASSNAEQNLTNCITKCRLPNLQLIAAPLASANAVLDDASRELGVCVIDIGHDTTGIALFVAGEIRHTAVLTWGGRQVNQDIAKSLFTPPQAAAQLKELHGSVVGHELDESEITVPGVNGRPDTRPTKSIFSQIIRAVYERIFHEVAAEFERHDLSAEFASARIVLTGGGSKIKNLAYLASEVLGLEAYVDHPKVSPAPNAEANGDWAHDQVFVADGVDATELNDPSMATVVGLLRRRVVGRIKTHQARTAKTRGVTSRVARSTYRWLGGNV